MEGRKWKRRRHTLLPLRASRLSNTISCYFCDFKIYALNQPLFHFGQNYSIWLRKWFSAGVGFSLAALIGFTLACAWEIARSVLGYGQAAGNSSMWSALLFGFSPRVSGLGISFSSFMYICISTLIAVSVHEFGHAVAAASEGIQMEYISVFLAVIFPGALVAFNSEVMQAMHKSVALRVYSAGIWHNAVCCALSALILFLLPLLLVPFYVPGEIPVVLNVSDRSPLSGFLAPGDVIISLDGMRIRSERDWKDAIALIDEDIRQLSNINSSKHLNSMAVYNSRKGYCVPRQMLEKGYTSSIRSSCPNELTEFVEIGCSEPTDSDISGNRYGDGSEGRHCLAGMDVVKLQKCGKALMADESSTCPCSEEDSCMSPVQFPGQAWIEVTYSRPYSTDCSNNNTYLGTDTKISSCGGTFVYVGDLNLLAQSLHLTTYQPRWALLSFSANLPMVLEKLVVYTFYTSLALALLNSMPVYFLDGEAMLEVIVNNFTFLHPRKRAVLLQISLIGGTAIFTIAFLMVIISIFWLVKNL